MKKIISLFLSFCLIFTLSGCKSNNKEEALAFFDAFHETLNANSGYVHGRVQLKNETMSTLNFKFNFNQVNQIQLAFDLGLQSGKYTQDQFISFYIKEGKTYLNFMGTKTQSLAEKIGIHPNDKLSVSDPFLNFSDEELVNFFTASSKNENTYSFEMNNKAISQLLDSLGTIDIDQAKMDCTIQNKMLSSLNLSIKGYQQIEKQSANIDIQIQCSFKNMNQLDSISFPNDLDTYVIQ